MQIFGDLGRELHEIPDLLLAEVRLKEYGDKLNQDLGTRFGLEQQHMLPELILFMERGAKEIRYRIRLRKGQQ